MMIFGGHSARLRGQPFGREDSDIDVFGTEAELIALTAAINNSAPGLRAILYPSMGRPRRLINGPANMLPEDWRRIEAVTLPTELYAIAQALPDNQQTELFGVTCWRSGLITDCLIKLGAIEEATHVDPKHAEDLADVGFTIDDAGPEHLEFYDGWRAFLAAQE